MTEYKRVVEAIQKNGLSWNEIDRILLNPDTYQEMQQIASFDISDRHTTDKPAVRETIGDEKIVYVSETGVEITVEI